MSYLTICVEFSNPNIVMGHIKDSRVCYTTNHTGASLDEYFVLYSGRKKNEMDTSRGPVKIFENVLIEDALSELSIDQGIQTFSTFENPQTFSFKIVDFDNAYSYITKNQRLSGRVLIKYSTEVLTLSNGSPIQSQAERNVALLDLYSVTVSNGIVTFECDSVSSWSDNQISRNVFYGDVQNKELEKAYTESIQLYQYPIPVRKVEDGRFPEHYSYYPGGGATIVVSDTYTAYNTIYKKGTANTWTLYLDLVDDDLNSDLVTLRNNIGNKVKVNIVDGKGVGTYYLGTLINVYDQGITSVGFGIEFDSNISDSPDLEYVTTPTGIVIDDNDIIISKIDSSSHVELFFEYNVYDMGSLDISDVNDISIIDDQGVLRNIPSTLLVFEDGKLKIPTDTTITYKSRIPLNLEYTSFDNVYNGDYHTGATPIQIDEAKTIISNDNTDNFVGARFAGAPGISNKAFFTFNIGDNASNLSVFKNADKYVLNGKIESVAVEGTQELDISYRWFDNREAGINIPFEYDLQNNPIDHAIKSFTNADNKWYTLNRTFVNGSYTGNVSGNENYGANKIELELTEDSDEIKTLGLYITNRKESFPPITSISNLRIYNINICAEFSYKITQSSNIYISLNNTHPNAGLNDIGKIVADLYTSATNNGAGAFGVGNTSIAPASFVNNFSNYRKAISSLISESRFCLNEEVATDFEGTDNFYYRQLIAKPTWDYSSFSLDNLPIIDIKSVTINDDWINTVRITSGDTYYQLGKNTHDGEIALDTNGVGSNWSTNLNTSYNNATSDSFHKDATIKNIDKELEYITAIKYLVGESGQSLIPFGKTYKVKFVSPLNLDVLSIFSFEQSNRFIITSHPALFNNSQCVMRINKMDINFQEQIVEFECFIYEIRDNIEEGSFTLWFDSPFVDYVDKIQDQLNNGNDDDWYVGIFG